jgi:uncharacterized protein (DUF1330 family)
MPSLDMTSEPTGSEAPAVETPAAEQGERPAWLPEKFESAEAMAAAYSELETKQSAGTEAAEGEETPAAAETPEGEETGDPVYTLPGVEADQLQGFFDEFAEGGALGDESYAKLNEAGYDRAMVDSYIKGATEANGYTPEQESSIMKAAGGEAEYGELMGWAAKNMSPEDQATYNALMATNDPAIANHAVNWLKASHDKVEGSDPELVHGERNTGPAVAPFQSQAQVTAAMKDPRYKKDPAYRAEVASRLSSMPS